MARTRRRSPKSQAELQFGRADGPTVKRVVAYYLDSYLRSRTRARTPATIATQRSALDHLAKVLPPYPTPGQVREAIQAKIDAGQIGESTANQFRKYLSHAYEHARNEWPTIAVRNPCVAFGPWTPPLKAPRGMRDPDATFALLLERACLDDGERSLLYALCLLGLRIGEARGIHIQRDLTPDLQQLTIRRQRRLGASQESDPKTAASVATFDVPEPMRAPLRRWLQCRAAIVAGAAAATALQLADARSPYLWPYGQRRLYGPAGLMGRVRALAPDDFPRRTTGTGGVAFHGFRDTLGATLARNGASLNEGQKALRQRSPTSTGGYFAQWAAPTNNPKLKEAQAALTTSVPARRGLRVVQ